MDIEKVKNYNQKMLAAFSTIITILAAVGLISLLVYLVIELIPEKKPKENVLLSDEKIEELKLDNLRQQIISYDTPVLLDTINLVYIIPVNVNTLSKSEELMGLLDTRPGKSNRSSGKYVESFYYGSFNNILVYDYKNNSTYKISDRRFIGTDLLFKYFEDDILITFSGAESDTDKDDIVTLKDLQSLFIYSLNEKKLRQISFDNSTVLSLNQILPYKDMLITFGLDRNKDNYFDDITEPKFVMKYDFNSDSLFAIVDPKLDVELQKIIDRN